MREPTDREQAIIDALVEEGRPRIRSEFNADSCIASTRIGIDVLAKFGIAAHPLPLQVMLFNAEAAQMLTSGTSMEELAALLKTIPADRPGGPWTLGVGVGPALHGRWAGHLVIAVPTIGTVIDLSIDQGSRPHKNMHVDPYAATFLSGSWWDPTRPDYDPMQSLTAPDGTIVFLDRRATDPEGYRSSPNWRRKSAGSRGAVFKDVTGQIIRAVRARL